MKAATDHFVYIMTYNWV